MSGKKFIVYFALATVVTSVLILAWMKHGYDTRPQIQIEQTK
jgi:hypothetical protein